MDVEQNAKLADRCAALAEVAQEAAGWVRKNRELVRGEHDGLLAELRRSTRFFRRCRTAAMRKMCVGVFGPSQAGKSYLISALASDAQGGLMADFNGKAHDFVSEINPSGGKESTGLVTRFTMTPPPQLPEGFPVQVRLLSETDLVKIFANTYYADCEHEDEPDAAAISEALDVLEKRAQQSPGRITLDDFEELQEYLAKNFKSKSRVQELFRVFWPRALEIGPLLETRDRLKLYGLIWDNVEVFDRTLAVLVSALDSLGHPDSIFCSLEALIPREKSIIDVAMLLGLADNDQKDVIEIASAQGARISLSRPVLAALTAELTIHMRTRPDDYYEHTDLLDFPGYRARYALRDLRHELKKPEMLKELFLRGKVAYLFQRYCTERELTSMLLCISTSNQEVQDLPGVINEWILSTHGETPERRKGNPVSLFFILTKCDLEFEEKKGQPDVKDRWDIRLHASLLDFFGRQYDWPHNWDGTSKFNNLFLLRNPNFRFDAMLNYENNRESSVREDKQGFVSNLKAAFLGSDLVRDHFVDQVAAWEAMMRFNDGGIGLIRDRLRPACNPVLKRKQIEISIAGCQERLLSRLKSYWQSDDREEMRKQKQDLARQLARIMAVMIQGQRFGEFLCRLCVHDHELHTLYYDVRRELRREESESQAMDHALVVGKTVDANSLLEELNIFDDEPAQKETPAPLATSFQDETAAFAARIEGYWCRRLRDISDDPVMQQYFGLSQKMFGDFVGELILGAARVNLRQEMEEAMRKAAAFADVDMERVVWKQSCLAARRINAFIDWLGHNPRTKSEAERTVTVNSKTVSLFNPPPAVQHYPQLSDEMGVLEKQWYHDWLMALIYNIMANVDFDGKGLLNIEQNIIIGSIIKTFSQQQ